METQSVKNESIKMLSECPETLIDQHWEYIGELLRVHGEEELFEIVKFHYRTAFAHGWKHAVEEMEKQGGKHAWTAKQAIRF